MYGDGGQFVLGGGVPPQPPPPSEIPSTVTIEEVTDESDDSSWTDLGGGDK